MLAALFENIINLLELFLMTLRELGSFLTIFRRFAEAAADVLRLLGF